MNVSVGTQTHPGRRPNNEDLLAVMDVQAHRLRADGVLIVADGMGGRSFGERAAREAVDAVQSTLAEMLSADRPEPVPVSEALASALRRANARVYDLAARDPESRGMGTTCVVAVIAGGRLHIAHAGDSRAYLLRDGQLSRLTDDHSYVAEQVRAGALTEDDARRSRFRNVITRAVGIEPTLAPDVSEQDAQEGDRLLLCTDGLTNIVDENALVSVLSADPPQEAVNRLVEQAVREGGTDNISAIAARLESGNRTQRMKADDLARLLTKRRAAAQRDGVRPAPPETPSPVEETPTVRPVPLPPLSAPPPPLSAALPIFIPTDVGPPPLPTQTAVMARPDGLTPPRRTGAVLAGVFAVLCVVLGVFGYIVLSAVRHDGYKLTTAPPFVVKPVPPAPPRPPDLAHVQYNELALLTPISIRSDVLSYSAADNAVTCITQTGQVLRLRADGQTLTKYALPPKYAPPAAVPNPVYPAPIVPPAVAPAAVVPSAAPPVSAGIYTASDTQGDLYVSDALHASVAKYAAGGNLLSSLAPGHWQKPGAIAVGTDGTVFVADAGRLKILRVHSPK